jgi:LAO/AO transport system kinase
VGLDQEDAALRDGLAGGDRRSLARAITLIESTRPDHRRRARRLLDALETPPSPSIRIGLSGAPGSGKSTLIEALGLHAAELGRRVAVLAVDPSSRVSGGSILGDKTRMSELARHPSAYIRPTPSAGTLGGVARRTREALLLCEAAGFDLVIVETVGVGQSEVEAADMVDLFVLVASPAGGDELQGIKRGIMELADLIVVNKADGDLAASAARAQHDLQHAVELLRPKRPGWTVDVLTCSSLVGTGIPELWTAIDALHARLTAGGLDTLRATQNVAWMWSEVTDTVTTFVRSDPALRGKVDALEAQVASGAVAPTSAALEILSELLPPEVADDLG